MVLVGLGEDFNGRKQLKDCPGYLSGCRSLEEAGYRWLFPAWLDYCFHKWNADRVAGALEKLADFLKDKNYFVISTCIDENIKKAAFDVERIVEPCGNYKMLQCSAKCTSELYPSKEFSDLVNQAILDGVGLDSLEIPTCPVCGKPLAFNNILCESNYIEDGYQVQWGRYTKWLQMTLNKKLCILELGVEMNLPNIIRWPFEKVAFYNQKASFFRINKTLYQLTEELGEKGVSISENAVEFLLECRGGFT